MKKRIFLGCFLFFCLLCGIGNALSVYQNESQLIQTSDLIIYGKIVDVKSAWNDQKTHIETTAQVLVNDTLKNSGSSIIGPGSTIPVTVLGGNVGNDTEWVEDMPILIKNTEAIFLLKKGNDGKNAVLKLISVSNGVPKSEISANNIVAFKQKITEILQNNASSTTTTQKAGMIFAPAIAIIGFLILIHNNRK